MSRDLDVGKLDRGAPHARRLYGRRKGHPLSARQTDLVGGLLPRLALDLAAPARDQAALFAEPVCDVWLEIGFGGGEHLAWQARAHPHIGIIGCEPFLNGVAKLLVAVEEAGLTNVRIHPGDARDVLEWLPEASLGRVFILHPDPWPKKRHWKRRFISADTLDRLAQLMKPGGDLRIASDIPSHVDWTLRLAAFHPAFEWTAMSPADWRQAPADWPRTRYEAKALREGRTPVYLTFRRR